MSLEKLKNSTGEKIMVIGGAGFIGSFVSRLLVNLNYNVVVYDAFIQYISPIETDYNRYLKYRFLNIKNQIKIIRGDTRDTNHLRKTIMEERPDRIINFAALTIVNLSNKYSDETQDSIFNGNSNILEVLRSCDFIKQFVYISSSMAYGDFQYTPCSEDHPKNPKSLYGAYKYCGEVMTKLYGDRYGIPYSIVRPSAVYGPTDLNKRVLQIFTEAALDDREITINGNGKSVLDNSYVKDVADGIVRVLLDERAQSETFNITYGKGYSLNDIVEQLSNILNKKLKVNYKKLEDDFTPERGALDISKAKRELGYNPKYSLTDGLSEYISFLKATSIRGDRFEGMDILDY